jgi:FAD/FMN-containing dehydrogenase
LSLMKGVHVDPASKTARVQPGATLADFDKEAQAFGLATPLGINSTTGVAGLTLGGGFGWTTRKFGLTVDNLISADVVTADAKLVRASSKEHEDLFWASRGGGGNFGVVTSFEFNLHPLGPEVLSGLVVHPLENAGELLSEFRRIANEAPDELTIWVVMRKAPPLPFIPTEWHGKEVLIFAACYSGEMKEGEQAVKPLRALGKPIADVISPHPFTGWEAAFDPLLTPGPAIIGRVMISRNCRTRRSESSSKRCALCHRPNVRCSSPTSVAPWRACLRTPRRGRIAMLTSS